MLHILIKIWIQLRDTFLLVFRNAIVVNGYVDDFTWFGIRHRNWGDDLNFYFIQEITGRPVVMYHNFWVAKRLKLKNYLCIGTLLDAINYSNRQTIVWGSGVSGQERTFVKPLEIKSVRGPKTKEFCERYNITCPAVYGDPAMLLPLYYQPKCKQKKYKLGIIPHVIDLEEDVVNEIRTNHPEILLIDLAHYKNWTDVIDEICLCENIASSSLHGLIVSDAYCVPNCWIEISGNISGGYFKFYDYASSVNRLLDKPYKLTSVAKLADIYNLCKKWESTKVDPERVLEVCPFEVSLEFLFKH